MSKLVGSVTVGDTSYEFEDYNGSPIIAEVDGKIMTSLNGFRIIGIARKATIIPTSAESETGPFLEPSPLPASL